MKAFSLMQPALRRLVIVGLLCGFAAASHAEIPSVYLNRLPDPPAIGCFADGRVDPNFMARIEEVSDQLNTEIAERRRILKEAQNRHSKTQQEAVMPQPGSEGVDGVTLQQMSREAKRQKAEQVMEEQLGVSMEELKKLKKTSREGQQGWGKAMLGQLQADAAMDPARAAKTAQATMQTAQLAQRQADLAQKIQAALSKWEQKMAEIEPNPDADAGRAEIERQVALMGDPDASAALKGILPQENKTTKTLREAVKADEDKLNALMAAYASCPDLNFQKRRLYSARESYCTTLSSIYLSALNGYRTAVVSSLADAAEMDRVQMEIQQVQFGVTMPPEQADMAALGLVRDYIARLRTAYQFDLTPETYVEFPCDGKLGR